ncbi:MAG TPA: hypothetical protein VFI46_07650, partial [Jiangellaceae bacterium]|nr:hypothetical protein [Jiangellaceae bacterium]
SVLAGFPVGASSDPRVYFEDPAGHVRELAYFQRAWHNRDVTADSGAPAAMVRSVLAGFPVGASSDPRVYFEDPAGHVRELAYFQRAWHNRDVTADSGAPAGVASSKLAGFPSVNDPRVYYADPVDHVQELAYVQGAWHNRDVTANSGAPAAVARSALAGFPVGDPRVYYLSPGRRVRELAYAPPTRPGGQGA